MEEYIENTTPRWYFYMRDWVCKIGPYTGDTGEVECRKDFEKYQKTGRVSLDPEKIVGPKCADCEGGEYEILRRL